MKNGFLVIDKPKNVTSHDIVKEARILYNTKKVGHCGTLDPFATGVLVLAINKATKFLQFLISDNKTYRVKARLGIITDSYDITGNIIEKNEVPDLSKEFIIKTLKSFEGKSKQIPPIYCAKKINGKRLFKYARAGKTVDIPPIDINISNIKDIIVYENNEEIEFTVTVSSGTYIRTLINDIGKKIGCGATAIELRRLKSGIFSLEQSVKKMEKDSNFVPISKALNIPFIKVNNKDKVLNGIQIYKENILQFSKFEKNQYVKILDDEKNFIGVGKAERSSKFLKTLLRTPERNDRIIKLYKILK
ncbi:tRNA pseudouridine synthase B [Tepiditoga spiralis]|uniref:tRNA pseudouridine synthase B n=1 Tax=Tepiditoga spiralis TaxID=2108365 RepID=A0A7G1G738_9BACT|nr:tRNA pseudouridine(55) synthase TruB [Tepiditoga spiralis]BBE30984.1 tRNA pseudouridine synthase B [Tepiditoga spiralis]